MQKRWNEGFKARRSEIYMNQIDASAEEVFQRDSAEVKRHWVVEGYNIINRLESLCNQTALNYLRNWLSKKMAYLQTLNSSKIKELPKW